MDPAVAGTLYAAPVAGLLGVETIFHYTIAQASESLDNNFRIAIHLFTDLACVLSFVVPGSCHVHPSVKVLVPSMRFLCLCRLICLRSNSSAISGIIVRRVRTQANSISYRCLARYQILCNLYKSVCRDTVQFVHSPSAKYLATESKVLIQSNGRILVFGSFQLQGTLPRGQARPSASGSHY